MKLLILNTMHFIKHLFVCFNNFTVTFQTLRKWKWNDELRPKPFCLFVCCCFLRLGQWRHLLQLPGTYKGINYDSCKKCCRNENGLLLISSTIIFASAITRINNRVSCLSHVLKQLKQYTTIRTWFRGLRE